MRRISALLAAAALVVGTAVVTAPAAHATASNPADLYYPSGGSCASLAPNQHWQDASGTELQSIETKTGWTTTIHNLCSVTIYVYSGDSNAANRTPVAPSTTATVSLIGNAAMIGAYTSATNGGSLMASIYTMSPTDVTVTGTPGAPVLSVSSVDLAVGDTMIIKNNTGGGLNVVNGTGAVTKFGTSCTSANTMMCQLSGATGMYDIAALGTITIGSATLTIGAAPAPSSSKPGTPGAPTAVAGVGAATVTVVAPTSGGTPVTYTVTSSPDSKSCTVTVPATSCEVTGLTNGTAYTFTATATNADGTSDASAASNSVTPDLKSNTPTTAPKFAKTSSIAHPGKSIILKKAVVTPSGEVATPRVRFVEFVQGLRPFGDSSNSSTKLGTYKVLKSGKVVANVLSSQPMTIVMTLRAPATTEYKAYKQVKTWVLK